MVKRSTTPNRPRACRTSRVSGSRSTKRGCAATPRRACRSSPSVAGRRGDDAKHRPFVLATRATPARHARRFAPTTARRREREDTRDEDDRDRGTRNLRRRVGCSDRIGTAGRRLPTERAEHPGRAVPVHLPRPPGHLPGRRAGRPEGPGAHRAGLRHDQGGGRPVVRDHDAAGRRLPLLHAVGSTAPWSPTPRPARISDRASTTARSRCRSRPPTPSMRV